VRAYKITVIQNSTLTQPGAGQGMPMQADISADAKLFVDRKNPDNTYAVRYRMGGIKGTALAGGMAMPIPGLPDKMEVAGTLMPDGSFKPSTKTSASAGFGSTDPSQTLSGLFTNLMSIPDRPMAVGETWQSNVALPMDPSGANTVRVTNKIVSLDTVNGQQVARVEHVYSGPLNMSITQPVPATISGTFSGTGTSRVSVATGQTLTNTGKVQMSMDVEMPNQAGNGEPMKMHMDSTVTTKIESMLLPAKAPVKPAPKAGAKKPAQKKK